MSCTRARVIVGVTGSLTNLRALRAGAAVARARQAVLYAVQIWETGDTDATLLATAHKPAIIPRIHRVHQAFDEAMGGRPDDLDVRVLVLEGTPADRLARLGDRDDDLLVIGASPRRWWRSRWTPTVAARCLRRARCPVLVVPPTEMARLARREGLDGLVRPGAAAWS